MNAAIVGATGLVGSAMLKMLIELQRYKCVFVIGRRQPQWLSQYAEALKQSQQTLVVFIKAEIADFPNLELDEPIDTLYCALGTTIKQAGSQDAFIAVDKTAIIDIASRVIQMNPNANKLVLVSAHGASAESKVFYNRVKGETEQAAIALGYQHVVILRPSLLIGKRSETRILEDIGQSASRYFAPIFRGPLLTIKPIEHQQVAAAMLYFSMHAQQSVEIVSNKQMHLLADKLAAFS
ncbi:nucleoside-diphosphate sugar epimerase [Shewanella maritima]|uniref:Nucleoside-diphosphate sugar epimerase n=1 Tax=Shewanella maritima TaxID=2520507 RepID=A0A411PJ93_9GAMM|nr:nucleoside-diphosphate sugar epimerase [Shewanella maritima]QBF83613.1 nucleoside-diphosphate sugar epimerase [Shewanella maritima]